MGFFHLFRTAKQNAQEASVDANDTKNNLFGAAKKLDSVEIKLNNVAKNMPENAPASITRNIAISMNRMKNHAKMMRHHVEQLERHIDQIEQHIEEANRHKK